MKNMFKIKIAFEGKAIHNIKADNQEEAEKDLKKFFGKFR